VIHAGTIAACTNLHREGERVSNGILLEPGEAVINEAKNEL
jgi:hypothetical protein